MPLSKAFRNELNKINNKDIRNNLRNYFPDDLEAAQIAVVVDKLIGKLLDDIDKRTKKISKDIRFHFDDPSGRIRKIENRLNTVDDKLDKLLEHLGVEYDEDEPVK